MFLDTNEVGRNTGGFFRRAEKKFPSAFFRRHEPIELGAHSAYHLIPCWNQIQKGVWVVEIGEWIAVGSVTLAFFSFAVQLFWNRQQKKAEALIKICEGNREVVGLGFGQAHLFTLFGKDDAEAELRRRYCQLWPNRVELMFRLRKPLAFASTQWQGSLRDMRDFEVVPENGASELLVN